MKDLKCVLYRVVHRESGKDYVGISTAYEQRWQHHKADAARGGKTSCPKFHRALRKYGPDAFDWKVLAWTSCFSGAAVLEQLAIALGMGALNLTKGGEGSIGKVLSAESRAKISAAGKGRIPKNKGVPCSEQTKAKLRVSSAGRTHNRGRIHTLEAKANIQAAARRRQGVLRTEDEKKKISAGMQGHVVSDETKQKIGKAHRGKHVSLESRIKMSASHTGVKMSTEHVARRSAAQTGLKRSAETKAKISAGHKRRSEAKRLAAALTEGTQ